jgi:hypothetical protein
VIRKILSRASLENANASEFMRSKREVSRHGDVWESGGTASHTFLTSVLYGGEWSVSRHSRFTPEERATDRHWRGDWVGPRAGLVSVAKSPFTESLY